MYQITIGGEGETAQTDNAEYFLNSYRRMSIRIIVTVNMHIFNLNIYMNYKKYLKILFKNMITDKYLKLLLISIRV